MAGTRRIEPDLEQLKKDWEEKKGIRLMLSHEEFFQFIIDWLKDLENRVQKLERLEGKE